MFASANFLMLSVFSATAFFSSKDITQMRTKSVCFGVTLVGLVIAFLFGQHNAGSGEQENVKEKGLIDKVKELEKTVSELRGNSLLIHQHAGEVWIGTKNFKGKRGGLFCEAAQGKPEEILGPKGQKILAAWYTPLDDVSQINSFHWINVKPNPQGDKIVIEASTRQDEKGIFIDNAIIRIQVYYLTKKME